MKTHEILVVVRHPVGGIRSFLRYFYRRLRAERYRFTLVAPRMTQTEVLLEDLLNLDVRFIAVEEQAGVRGIFRTVTRVIRSQRFDLVHSHGILSAASTIPGALLTRTPHLVTCHEAFADGQLAGIKGAAKSMALGIVLAMVDRVHCVSNDARSNLLEHVKLLRLFASKVVAIENGIEVEPFHTAERRDLRSELGLPPNSFLIGFLGRFMSPKGFRYLVEALERLGSVHGLERMPLVLTFSEQDGFYREEMADVRRRGLDAAILFRPFVRDVASTLKGLDVVAMPSLWEACPLLAMEAMVAGIPVVGTDCVGLREVLRDTPATAVPSRDSFALSEALLREMRNPSTDRARRFAPEAAVRFDVRARADELEQLILGMLRGDATARRQAVATRSDQH